MRTLEEGGFEICVRSERDQAFCEDLRFNFDDVILSIEVIKDISDISKAFVRLSHFNPHVRSFVVSSYKAGMLMCDDISHQFAAHEAKVLHSDLKVRHQAKALIDWRLTRHDMSYAGRHVHHNLRVKPLRATTAAGMNHNQSSAFVSAHLSLC